MQKRNEHVFAAALSPKGVVDVADDYAASRRQITCSMWVSKQDRSSISIDETWITGELFWTTPSRFRAAWWTP
ncbi:MAG: hypothetical protein AAF333_08845 [Planctomycetota bacterium]